MNEPHDRQEPQTSDEAATVVTVDSRLLYMLIGLVGLVAVAALGLLIGSGELSAGATAAGGEAGAAQAEGTTGPVVNYTINAPTAIDGAPIVKPVIQGAYPMSLSDVPVGPGEPRIWFPELAESGFVLDLGDVPPTGPVKSEIVVQNIGQGTLQLTEAGGSCGCTAFSFEPTELGPGESTTFRAQYDPRVSEDAGKQVKKQVWVKSNDPLFPAAEFHIVANVLPE
jgi:hypothetical protein